jgi:hypothetical protein
MEAAPASTFVMAEADFLFQLLIIAFDAPAQLDGVDKLIERDVGRQGRQPVLGRFGFVLGPFDDQPFLGAQFAAQIVAMSRMDAHARATPFEDIGGAFAPFNDLKGLLGQVERQLCSSSASPDRPPSLPRRQDKHSKHPNPPLNSSWSRSRPRETFQFAKIAHAKTPARQAATPR